MKAVREKRKDAIMPAKAMSTHVHADRRRFRTFFNRSAQYPEAYLEYLGMHDALTGLRNRSFFTDEINRLERHGP
jgi:GGDEF domain-containing protein